MSPVELLAFITTHSLMLIPFGLVLLLAGAIGTTAFLSLAIDLIILGCLMLFCLSMFIQNSELLVFIILMVTGVVGVMSYIALMACGLLPAKPTTRFHPLLRAAIALVGFAMLAGVLIARYVC